MPETPRPAPGPVGGDPSKPGAWTPEQIAEWNRVKDCDHVLLSDRDESCARCGTILRTITTAEDWADHWAEEHKENGGRGRPFIRSRR